MRETKYHLFDKDGEWVDTYLTREEAEWSRHVKEFEEKGHKYTVVKKEEVPFDPDLEDAIRRAYEATWDIWNTYNEYDLEDEDLEGILKTCNANTAIILRYMNTPPQLEG